MVAIRQQTSMNDSLILVIKNVSYNTEFALTKQVKQKKNMMAFLFRAYFFCMPIRCVTNNMLSLIHI